jgi:hypothetical protein
MQMASLAKISRHKCTARASWMTTERPARLFRFCGCVDPQAADEVAASERKSTRAAEGLERSIRKQISRCASRCMQRQLSRCVDVCFQAARGLLPRLPGDDKEEQDQDQAHERGC